MSLDGMERRRQEKPIASSALRGRKFAVARPPASYAAMASRIASGCMAATFSRLRAGPDGLRRPCSQS